MDGLSSPQPTKVAKSLLTQTWAEGLDSSPTEQPRHLSSTQPAKPSSSELPGGKNSTSSQLLNNGVDIPRLDTRKIAALNRVALPDSVRDFASARTTTADPR